MPESQVEQLIVMMNRAPAHSRLEVCLPPFEVKRSSLEKLVRGDILRLPTQRLEVTIFKEGYQVVAHGLYGNYNGAPSILIEKSAQKSLSSSDSKKYELLKIALGEVEKKEFIQGKIVKLHQDKMYDATLYRGKEPIAYASFVQVDKKAALQIEEVK